MSAVMAIDRSRRGGTAPYVNLRNSPRDQAGFGLAHTVPSSPSLLYSRLLCNRLLVQCDFLLTPDGAAAGYETVVPDNIGCLPCGGEKGRKSETSTNYEATEPLVSPISVVRLPCLHLEEAYLSHDKLDLSAKWRAEVNGSPTQRIIRACERPVAGFALVPAFCTSEPRWGKRCHSWLVRHPLPRGPPQLGALGA